MSGGNSNKQIKEFFDWFDEQFILELGKYYVFQDGWEEELYVDEL